MPILRGIHGLIRFLISLPARLARAVGHSTCWDVMLLPLAGRMTSTRPAWMHSLAAAIRRKPLEIGGGRLPALLVVATGWFGWQWYLHHPHPAEPNLITFVVDGPTITDYGIGNGARGHHH